MSDIRRISPNNINPGSRTVQITDRALAKISAAFEQERLSNEQVGLRLELSGGGCSGLSYELRFESSPQPRDRVFRFGDLPLFVSPKSFIYAIGSVLDWEESRGFSVADPHWPNPCGCGSSFAAKPAFPGKSN